MPECPKGNENMEKYFYFDRYKSLEELEGVKWENPSFNSHLTTNCHELRKKPLSQFSVENLRILIGQRIGLNYLVPLAIEYLEDNPFTSGDLYDGDLLESILSIENSFWLEHPELKSDLEKILHHWVNYLTSTLQKLSSIQS